MTQRRSKEAEPTAARVWLGRLTWSIWFGLFFAAWMFPVEGTVGVFAGVPLAWGWMLLSLLLMANVYWMRLETWRWSWCDVLVGLFLVWTACSSAWLVWQEQCYARATLNLTVQFWGLGAVYALGRIGFLHLLTTRWLLSLVAAAITFLATVGLYEYAIEMPQVRRQYFDAPEAEKQRMLGQAGVADAAADSRERKLYEDRFRATEPLATFAHTNSLGAVLGVGLALLGGWWLLGRAGPLAQSTWWSHTVLLGALVAMASCLVLTKSRTGFLAVIIVGIAWGLRRRFSARVVAVLAGTGMVLSLLVFGLIGIGILDVEVLSEAPKSVLYRLEYWQATVAMIADHPLWGIGLGSFQDAYPRYQLPQASETIADPHNALLETAATLGLPGLVLLLGIVIWCLKDLTRALPDDREAEQQSEVQQPLIPGTDPLALAIGILLTLILATTLSLVVGFLPAVTKWAVGCPLAVLVGAGCYFKLSLDRSTVRSLIGAALAVWAINLLAAGGFTAWNVAQIAWLLLGGWVACSPDRKAVRVTRTKLVLKTLAMAACLWLAWAVALQPVIGSWKNEQTLNRSMAFRSINTGKRILAEWHQVDPFSDAAWQRESQLAYSQWQREGDPQARPWVLETIAASEQIRPGVAARYRTFAQGFHMAYRNQGTDEDLAEAIRLQERVTDLAPTDALGFIQLAWWQSQMGQTQLAAESAARALELDQLNPHVDRALKNRFVFEGGGRYRDETAEQLARRLRSEAEGN